MSIRIRLHGDEDLIRKLRPAVVDPPIRRFLLRGAITVQGELRERVRVDTGRGRNSIAYEVGRRKARIGTNLLYLEVMARGRKPGRPWPPPGALHPWMRRHGIPLGKPPKPGGKAIYFSNEFLLARKIGRKGIDGDDFDRKAVDASIPKIERLVPILAREIERAMAGGAA